jgi:hypothetical protein
MYIPTRFTAAPSLMLALVCFPTGSKVIGNFAGSFGGALYAFVSNALFD